MEKAEEGHLSPRSGLPRLQETESTWQHSRKANETLWHSEWGRSTIRLAHSFHHPEVQPAIRKLNLMKPSKVSIFPSPNQSQPVSTLPEKNGVKMPKGPFHCLSQAPLLQGWVSSVRWPSPMGPQAAMRRVE